MKRLEHFWKGLSNNSSQISPIPPQPYGERFLNFITGITMTKEEADRRATLESDRPSVDAHNLMHHHHIPPSNNGLTDGAAIEPIHSPRPPEEVEKTMEKAQEYTDKQTSSKGRRRSEEEDVPDRTLGVHQDSTKPAALLPVVAEAPEGSSQKSEKSTGLSAPQIEHSPISDHGMKAPEELAYDEKTEAVRSRERVETITETEFEFDEKRVSKPPRIGSGIIPTLTPLMDSSDAFEELRGIR